jgi:FMN phosphatase YigB (HAD superfamily)
MLVADVGDVIVRTRTGEQYRELARRTGHDAGGLAQLLTASGLPAQLEHGTIGEVEFAHELGQLLGRPGLSMSDVWECWAAEIAGIDPVVAPAMAKWAQAGRLVLASNTNVLHWSVVSQLLDEAGIKAPAYLSFELGLTKPDPRFFARIEVDGVAVYVDDRAENVAAAQDAGMTGWLHSDSTATADHLIALLDQGC